MMRIQIEYCVVWNYQPRAVGLATSLLEKFQNGIAALTLIPSSGGVFEIKKNDEIIFSKKKLGRFPEPGEVEKLIA